VAPELQSGLDIGSENQSFNSRNNHLVRFLKGNFVICTGNASSPKSILIAENENILVI